MKILKDGTIAACCEWADERNKDSTLLKGVHIRKIWMIATRRREGGIILDLNFCPNCGAKTEIEGEEK